MPNRSVDHHTTENAEVYYSYVPRCKHSIFFVRLENILEGEEAICAQREIFFFLFSSETFHHLANAQPRKLPLW